MSKIVVYTYLPVASKIVFEIDGAKTGFKSVGGAEGVPPGVMITEADETVAWISAQAFGVAYREDHLISVEAIAP